MFISKLGKSCCLQLFKENLNLCELIFFEYQKDRKIKNITIYHNMIKIAIYVLKKLFKNRKGLRDLSRSCVFYGF